MIDVSTLGKFRVAGSGGGRVARAALPEPVRRSAGRPGALRSDAERRGRDRRRRRCGAGRRRRVLRHGDERQHRGARTMDDVVAGRLAARRAAAERHRRLRGREPRRSGCARGDDAASPTPTCPPRGCPTSESARIDVAGVPALVLRIGFVGELGYEIHFPSMYGDDVWARLMEAGEPNGIEPFGLEAQRILRLEKQHILIGQDTDAESDPYEVGLGWMVKARQARLPRQAVARRPRGGRPGRAARRVHLRGRLAAPRGRVDRARGHLGRPGHFGSSQRRGRLDRGPRLGAGRMGDRGHAVRDPVRAVRGAGTRRVASVLRPTGTEASIMRRLRS